MSVFGPGHRANATIGRAIRLVISNVTGAVPGILDKSTLGHAGKYTWCIAEAEELSPWESLHVERGLSAHQSSVTVFAGLSPIQVSNQGSHRPGPILTSFSDAMFVAGPGQSEIVVVLGPEHVGHIASAGWSKTQVKEFLWELARRKISEWSRAGASPGSNAPFQDMESELSVAQSAEGITIIVAGGAAGAFSAVIPLWSGGSRSRSVTREIRIPS